MVIEHRLPVSESSTKTWTFHATADFEHKLHKARIESWLPIGFELGISNW